MSELTEKITEKITAIWKQNVKRAKNLVDSFIVQIKHNIERTNREAALSELGQEQVIMHVHISNQRQDSNPR